MLGTISVILIHQFLFSSLPKPAICEASDFKLSLLANKIRPYPRKIPQSFWSSVNINIHNIEKILVYFVLKHSGFTMLCHLHGKKVIYIFFSFSIMDYYRILNTAPVVYSRTLLFLCSICNRLWMLIPNFQSSLLHLPTALATTRLASMSVSQYRGNLIGAWSSAWVPVQLQICPVLFWGIKIYMCLVSQPPCHPWGLNILYGMNLILLPYFWSLSRSG